MRENELLEEKPESRSQSLSIGGFVLLVKVDYTHISMSFPNWGRLDGHNVILIELWLLQGTIFLKTHKTYVALLLLLNS